MGYGYISDNQEELGYISKEKILKYVTEEEVFSLVFGYLPKEMEYVTSPFRNDGVPGCWFERMSKNILRFKDYVENYFPDCFDAVRRYYQLPSFYHTLVFIYKHLIEGKDLEPVTHQRQDNVSVKNDFIIGFQGRNFTKEDAKFWMPYGINREQLISDSVFPVSHVFLKNTKKGDVSYRLKDICYAYTDFEDGRVKLYYPHNSDKRFITNCVSDDIGCTSSLPQYGRQLIITKSYKDCRVIRNMGRNSVWFQNEGVIPSKELLIKLVKRFKNVVVLYDNDKTGREKSVKVSQYINEIFPGKARALWIPEEYLDEDVTDPADLKKHKGQEILSDFFADYLL